MVPMGPERWQRQRLGERGDRQPPVHTSTPRNDWGCTVGSWRKNGPRRVPGAGEHLACV